MVQQATGVRDPEWHLAHQRSREDLEESSGHRTAGSRRREFEAQDTEGRWSVAENIRRIGQSGDDPYPTGDHVSTVTKVTYRKNRHTLHFNGLPLTLYPESWQIAIAAFS